MKVLAHSPGTLQYHTEQTLRYLKNASHQLQASGADLGGDVLFHGRVGFSGTPSDLLPHGMGPCHFEPGSEAAMIRVLSSQSSMGTPIQLRKWDVNDLLMNVAKHDPPLRALIDVGALVTGMSNEQVADKLLELDAQNRNPRFEACVFLNEHDIEMVEVQLQLLVCKIDAELLEMVRLKHLESENVEHRHLHCDSFPKVSACTPQYKPYSENVCPRTQPAS